MEIICGFVFTDIIFRQRDTKAGNTSVFAGYPWRDSFMACHAIQDCVTSQKSVCEGGYILTQHIVTPEIGLTFT